VLPEVTVFDRFKPFIEDILGGFTEETPRFAAHLDGGLNVQRLFVDSCSPTLRYTLAVGPEGGFVPYEADLLSKHGFHLIASSIGALRVESAVSYFAGQLDAMVGAPDCSSETPVPRRPPFRK